MPGKSPRPNAAEGEAHAEALWRSVIEDVRPLKGRRPASKLPVARLALARSEPVEARAPVAAPAVPAARLATAPGPNGTAAAPSRPPANTLDAAWDRKLARGVTAPDCTIDLHGHTLASAHAELEAGLCRAVARHARLVLLVTGRPPSPGRNRLDSPLRGVIRASIGDWLDQSRHAGHIAAIRNAHPRHGGAGALYVILRRARG